MFFRLFFKRSVDCKLDFRVAFCSELSISNVTGCDSKCEQSVDCDLYFRIISGYVFDGKFITTRNSKIKIVGAKRFEKKMSIIKKYNSKTEMLVEKTFQTLIARCDL